MNTAPHDEYRTLEELIAEERLYARVGLLRTAMFELANERSTAPEHISTADIHERAITIAATIVTDLEEMLTGLLEN